MPKELNKQWLQIVIAELISIRKANGIKQEDVYFDTGRYFDLTLTTLKKLTDYYKTDLTSLFKKTKQ